MKLFDLHCDTALAVYQQNASIQSNPFHISLEKAAGYSKYIQMTAVFTDTRLSDEAGWEQFWRVREKLVEECDAHGVPLLRTSRELDNFLASKKKAAFLLTVEDARILNGRPERVRMLYDAGVRVVTPLWGGFTCIGGSHDRSEGLTAFGKECVSEMLACGILPDLSHASFASADDILDLCEEAGKPPIATHMNSYAICPHSRNLTDERLTRLVSLGGIVGVSLCPAHLSPHPEAVTADDILAHISHYYALAPHAVAFGCDYDGTNVPAGLNHVGKLASLSKALPDDAIDDIYFGNAYAFLRSALPQQ